MSEILIALALAAVLVLCAVILVKLRNAHLLLYRVGADVRTESDNLFRQLEALQNLHLELDLKQGLPATRGWAASPDFLLELARHALRHKPRTAVECSSGASTLVLARCMQLNGGGMVYSLEHDAAYAQQTRDNLARLGLADFARVLDAPLQPAALAGGQWNWYAYQVLPADLQIDLLAIDGPPMESGPLARYPAGPALFGRLGSDAAVFLDDAARPEEQAILARWRAEFPQLAQSIRYCEKGCTVLRAPAAQQPVLAPVALSA